MTIKSTFLYQSGKYNYGLVERPEALYIVQIDCKHVIRRTRYILLKETVAVYCENHTEHTDAVRTSQETHYVSTTETNRLVLFGETFSV
jgi:hypothetical protein